MMCVVDSDCVEREEENVEDGDVVEVFDEGRGRCC